MRRKKERGRGVRGRQGGAGGYNRSGTRARSKQIIHQMLDDKKKKKQRNKKMHVVTKTLPGVFLVLFACARGLGVVRGGEGVGRLMNQEIASSASQKCCQAPSLDLI